MSDDFDNFIDDEELPKSKSQVKREMHALQELGEKLLSLNSEQLDKLNLPFVLLNAIKEAKKISSRGARRRQLQYIGRLMRDIEDPSYIIEYFQKLETKHQRTIAFHHMLESWREKLLSDDSEAITEFIKLFPNVDRQHLRQLITNAKKEHIQGKSLGASKSLFRYLRDLQSEKDSAEEHN